MEKLQVIVCEYPNEIDAEIAKAHLRSSGIPSNILKDDGGCMLPSLQNSEGVRLAVAEDQREKAKKILRLLS
jgi:Putative prokaryotic signal transducing protein